MAGLLAGASSSCSAGGSSSSTSGHDAGVDTGSNVSDIRVVDRDDRGKHRNSNSSSSCSGRGVHSAYGASTEAGSGGGMSSYASGSNGVQPSCASGSRHVDEVVSLAGLLQAASAVELRVRMLTCNHARLLLRSKL